MSVGPLRCDVVWAPPSAPDLTRLDAVERGRIERLTQPADRARFATGRALARRLAGELLGCGTAAVELDATCPECGEPHGRPIVLGTDLVLSISHAADRVLVAAARGAGVGADVEPVAGRPGLSRPGAGVLTATEHRMLHALPDAERAAGFTTLWTRKEAVLKALGVGLRIEPVGLAVSAPSAPPSVLRWPDDVPGHPLVMATVDVGPGYRACVAVLSDRPLQLRVRELPAGT